MERNTVNAQQLEGKLKLYDDVLNLLLNGRKTVLKTTYFYELGRVLNLLLVKAPDPCHFLTEHQLIRNTGRDCLDPQAKMFDLKSREKTQVVKLLKLHGEEMWPCAKWTWICRRNQRRASNASSASHLRTLDLAS